MRTRLPLLAVALAACGRASPPPSARVDNHAAAPAPAPGAARLAQPVDPEAAASMRSLAGRLDFEARHRPDGTPRAEAVIAALRAAGVTLAEEKQYLALTVHARYCLGGETGDGLAIAVCEYGSPADARAGRDYVQDRFVVAGMRRDIHLNRATTLALGSHASRPLADERARAERAFATL